MVTDAYAVRSTKKRNLVRRLSMPSFTGYLLSITLLISLSTLSTGATLQDLQREIDALMIAVDRDVSQDIEVINAISVVVAPPQSVTVATVEGVAGTTVNVPVYVKASTAPVSGVQFDIPNVPGLTISSVLPGLAAQAVGKSVSGNQNQTGYRVIVFGLNQTAIPSGPLVILRVDISDDSALEKKPILVSGISASSPSGGSVVLTGKAGGLTVK